MNTINVDPCSTCIARHGIEDMNGINDCCYATCAQFVSGGPDDILNSECGQRCQQCVDKSIAANGKTRCGGFRLPFPLLQSAMQYFKSCLEKTPEDPRGALGCCLKQCGQGDVTCQEQCITSFNSLIPVKEEYVVAGYTVKRGVVFLLFMIALQLALLWNKIPLPQSRGHIALVLVAIIVSLYIIIEQL